METRVWDQNLGHTDVRAALMSDVKITVSDQSALFAKVSNTHRVTRPRSRSHFLCNLRICRLLFFAPLNSCNSALRPVVASAKKIHIPPALVVNGRDAMSKLIILAALFAVTAVTGAVAEGARGPTIHLGYVENATIGKLGLEMKAKLDTGADTSSVHARNVELYQRDDGDDWVKFRLKGKNGRSVRYDQKVIRFVQIKTKTGGAIRRPVVQMPLCVGGRKARAEINLADRGDFIYDILIGREFLANRILVDSGKAFMAEDACDKDNDA